MWLAICSALGSFVPLFTLSIAFRSILGALRRRRCDARFFVGLGLIAAVLTGRHWMRLLRLAGADEPVPLTPERTGYAVGRGGVPIEWEEFGPADAPAILLCHGWSLSHDTWYYQKKALSREYRVIVWDMRGTGRSGMSPDRDYTLAASAEDLAAVFDATEAGRNRCVIVGHSYGAMILPLFACAYPERMKSVAGFAMLGGTDMPLLTTMRGGRVLSRMEKPFWMPVGRLMDRYPLFFEVFAHAARACGVVHASVMLGMPSGRESRGQADLIADHCAGFSMRAAALGAMSAFQYDVRELMPQIDVPVLVLTGERDVNAPARTQKAMAERLKRAELVLIKNCGHLSLLECPAEVSDHILRFAERVLT